MDLKLYAVSPTTKIKCLLLQPENAAVGPLFRPVNSHELVHPQDNQQPQEPQDTQQHWGVDGLKGNSSSNLPNLVSERTQSLCERVSAGKPSQPSMKCYRGDRTGLPLLRDITCVNSPFVASQGPLESAKAKEASLKQTVEAERELLRLPGGSLPAVGFPVQQRYEVRPQHEQKNSETLQGALKARVLMQQGNSVPLQHAADLFQQGTQQQEREQHWSQKQQQHTEGAQLEQLSQHQHQQELQQHQHQQELQHLSFLREIQQQQQRQQLQQLEQLQELEQQIQQHQEHEQKQLQHQQQLQQSHLQQSKSMQQHELQQHQQLQKQLDMLQLEKQLLRKKELLLLHLQEHQQQRLQVVSLASSSLNGTSGTLMGLPEPSQDLVCSYGGCRAIERSILRRLSGPKQLLKEGSVVTGKPSGAVKATHGKHNRKSSARLTQTKGVSKELSSSSSRRVFRAPNSKQIRSQEPKTCDGNSDCPFPTFDSCVVGNTSKVISKYMQGGTQRRIKRSSRRSSILNRVMDGSILKECCSPEDLMGDGARGASRRRVPLREAPLKSSRRSFKPRRPPYQHANSLRVALRPDWNNRSRKGSHHQICTSATEGSCTFEGSLSSLSLTVDLRLGLRKLSNQGRSLIYTAWQRINLGPPMGTSFRETGWAVKQNSKEACTGACVGNHEGHLHPLVVLDATDGVSDGLSSHAEKRLGVKCGLVASSACRNGTGGEAKHSRTSCAAINGASLANTTDNPCKKRPISEEMAIHVPFLGAIKVEKPQLLKRTQQKLQPICGAPFTPDHQIKPAVEKTKKQQQQVTAEETNTFADVRVGPLERGKKGDMPPSRADEEELASFAQVDEAAVKRESPLQRLSEASSLESFGSIYGPPAFPCLF